MRIPGYIVVIASLVTVVELVLKAYIPSLYSALGLYIPLIVVNCIILGRAEAYASKSTPLLAACDGLGMGLGFTIALTLIGIFRELIGAGTFFGMHIMPSGYQPVAIFRLRSWCVYRAWRADRGAERLKYPEQRQQEGGGLRGRLLQLRKGCLLRQKRRAESGKPGV